MDRNFFGIRLTPGFKEDVWTQLDCFKSPVDRGVGVFEPWHAENDRVDANGGDKEGLRLDDSGNRKLQGNLTIRMCKSSSIR